MSIKLKGSSDGSVSLDAPADTSPSGTDVSLTLPTSAGSANQFIKNGSTAGELEHSSMVEDSSGKVGIGVTPASNLDVSSTSRMRLDVSNAYTLQTHTNAAGSAFASSIASAADFQFQISDAERMRIASNGHVFIHTTTNFPGSGNTATGFMVEKASDGTTSFVSRNSGFAGYFNRNTAGGLVRFNLAGSEAGKIEVSSTGTSYEETSDYRLKENVVDLSDGITRLKQLQPRRFNFIADPEKTVDGFIAHEAQTVVPEAVSGTHNEVDDDGTAVMQGIDKSKLVPLLTAALQEAIAKIETLETKVAALEAAS